MTQHGGNTWVGRVIGSMWSLHREEGRGGVGGEEGERERERRRVGVGDLEEEREGGEGGGVLDVAEGVESSMTSCRASQSA